MRVSLRGARAALRTARDVADLGLAALELVGRALGDEPGAPGAPAPPSARTAPVATNGTGPGAAALDDLAAFAPDLAVGIEADEIEEVPADIVYVDGVDDDAAFAGPADDVELVEEVADPGAEAGAGASIQIAEPFAGYDALRAPDVIARLAGSDAATLAAIELYEQAHRRRKTVLDAIGREGRRRG